MAKRAAKKPSTRAAKKELPPLPSDMTKVISESAFKTLMRNIKGAEADKNESVGRIGALVSGAVEKNNLNKKAFSTFRAFDRMSGAKLADAMMQLEHLFEIGGLNERARQQNEMFGAAETGAVEEETEYEEPEAEAEPEPKAKKARKAPRKGSFAERATSLADAENADEELGAMRTRSLVQRPTSEEIKAAADRAEAAIKH